MAVRILLVDDNEIVVRELRSLLSLNPGWLVCGEVINGVEAVEKARSLRPDLHSHGHLHASNEWDRGNPNHPQGSS